MPELCQCPVQWLQDNFYGGSATKRIVIKEPSLTTPLQKANRRKNKTQQPRLCPHMLCVASLYLLPHTQQYCTIRTRLRGRPRVSYATCFVCHVFRMPRVLYTTCFVHHVFRTPCVSYTTFCRTISNSGVSLSTNINYTRRQYARYDIGS